MLEALRTWWRSWDRARAKRRALLVANTAGSPPRFASVLGALGIGFLVSALSGRASERRAAQSPATTRRSSRASLARDGTCSRTSSPSGARSFRSARCRTTRSSPFSPPKTRASTSTRASIFRHAARARREPARGGDRQGGSTITQQVVKNVLLDPERTMQAQDPGDDPRAAARAVADQGRDFRAVPEPHLSRSRSLRHRRGGAVLLRQEGARARTCPRRRCSPASLRPPSAFRRAGAWSARSSGGATCSGRCSPRASSRESSTTPPSGSSCAWRRPSTRLGACPEVVDLR